MSGIPSISQSHKRKRCDNRPCKEQIQTLIDRDLLWKGKIIEANEIIDKLEAENKAQSEEHTKAIDDLNRKLARVNAELRHAQHKLFGVEGTKLMMELCNVSKEIT